MRTSIGLCSTCTRGPAKSRSSSTISRLGRSRPAPPPAIGPKTPRIKGRVEHPVDVEFNRGDLTVGGSAFRGLSVTAAPRWKHCASRGFKLCRCPRTCRPNCLKMQSTTTISGSSLRFRRSRRRARSRAAAPWPPAVRRCSRRDSQIPGRRFGPLLGPALPSEDYRRTSRTVEAIRSADLRRPIGADVWDGFSCFAIPLQLVGTHRDPLMTSLELDRYGQWLANGRSSHPDRNFFGRGFKRTFPIGRCVCFTIGRSATIFPSRSARSRNRFAC